MITTKQLPFYNARWIGGPLRLDPGTHTLRAKAIRYGYLESEERTATFQIREE